MNPQRSACVCDVTEEGARSPAPGRLRVAVYSPGLAGWGHIRRNASIAHALRRSVLRPVIVMIAEARQVGALPMPAGVDCVTLPSRRRSAIGDPCPRFLDVSDRDLFVLRAAVIGSAFESLEPDVLIVDQLPLGTANELRRPLQRLRKRGNTCCVLGVRDVPWAPTAVLRTWPDRATANAIHRYFDAVWVYGDPLVYDPARACRPFPQVAARLRYTGYLDERARLVYAADGAAGAQPDAALCSGLPDRFALCVVGRGRDAEALANAFFDVDLPPHGGAVVVTGTTVEEGALRRLRRRARDRRDIRLLERVPDAALLVSRAERVIAMGGYHTLCEVLSFGKRALIVPRVHPSPEQWIRATRMQRLGLVDVLRPSRVGPAELGEWLARDLGPAPDCRGRIDLGGLTRIPNLLAQLIGAAPLAGAGAAGVPA